MLSMLETLPTDSSVPSGLQTVLGMKGSWFPATLTGVRVPVI